MDICFAAELGRKYTLMDIAFTGNRTLPDRELRAKLATAEQKVNVRGGRYRADWLTRDLVHVQALYYDHGHLNAELGQPKLTLDDRRGIARVEVKVSEGPRFRYGTIEIAGEPAAPPASYRALFAGESGDFVVRSHVVAWIQTLEQRERDAGRTRPSVTPVTELDSERGILDLRVEIRPE